MVWREIKAVGTGVQVGRQKVQLLLYADDIVLISDTQKDLQGMLDCVTEYSKSESEKREERSDQMERRDGVR